MLLAVVGGLQTMADWLHASLFLTNFRPVPLTEHAVFECRVFRKVGCVCVCVWVLGGGGGEGRGPPGADGPGCRDRGWSWLAHFAFRTPPFLKTHFPFPPFNPQVDVGPNGMAEGDEPLVLDHTLLPAVDPHRDPEGITSLVAEVRGA